MRRATCPACASTQVRGRVWLGPRARRRRPQRALPAGARSPPSSCKRLDARARATHGSCWPAPGPLRTLCRTPHSTQTPAEKKDIDSFEFSDFELEGYAPHKAIKMQVKAAPPASHPARSCRVLATRSRVAHAAMRAQPGWGAHNAPAPCYS